MNSEEILINSMKMTDLQKKAYDLMVEGKNLFLTGQGGTGKSMIIKKFRAEFRTKRNIAVTSTTGVSALLIGGTTLHSYLGIGLGQSSIDTLFNKIIKSKAKKNWTLVDTLIIDEVSMLNPVLFDKLENLGRLIRRNEKPFGGIQLILSGDWLQLPVIDSETFCFESKCWNRCQFNTVCLTENIRQKDEEFQKCLQEIRIGKLSEESTSLLKTLINKKLNIKDGILPTVMHTTNAEVDIINKRELENLAANVQEGVRKFYSYDMEIEITGGNPKYYDVEKLAQKYKKHCNAPTELILCKDAQVMLLYNLELEAGLVNGSRGVVTDFIEGIPVVKFLNGIEMLIDFKIWNYEEDDQIVVSISQVPLRLAYAITVHKCQGATLDYAQVNLRNVFEYAQVYTALSRVKNMDGLSIVGLDFKGIKAHPKALQFYKALG